MSIVSTTDGIAMGVRQVSQVSRLIRLTEVKV